MRWPIAVAVIVISGCGPNHLPSDAAQSAIQREIANRLKDPLSAQYQWLPMKPGKVYCGRVNAKNAMGGYVGFRPYLVEFSGKNIEDGFKLYFPTNEDDAPNWVSAECMKLGFDIYKTPTEN